MSLLLPGHGHYADRAAAQEHFAVLFDAPTRPQKARSARRRLTITFGTEAWLCGEAHGDGQAARGPWSDLESRSVRLGDVGDDRQAETESVRAHRPVRGGSLEWLEQ